MARDRVFYPTRVLESLIAGAFLALAVAGFKKNFFHHLFIQNPGGAKGRWIWRSVSLVWRH